MPGPVASVPIIRDTKKVTGGYFSSVPSRPAPSQSMTALWIVAAFLTVPLVVWVVRWFGDGWIPQGDQAIIAKAQRLRHSA